MKTNCLLQANLPSISTESERLELYSERETEERLQAVAKSISSLSTESLNILSLKLEELPDDAELEDFELALEDLDANNKNVFTRIGKAVKNLIEDFKSIKQNFAALNQSGVRDLSFEIKSLSGLTGYTDPGMVSKPGILNALACYETLGVCKQYNVSNFIDYHDWAVAQIMDSHAADSIHDFIMSFLYQREDYKKKGASTKFLDRISNREMRDWLSKDTECGAVARIAGPNTYIVSIKDASILETITSTNHLLFSTSIMRIDNYSCRAPGGFKSLSQKDVETLKKYLLQNEKTLDGLISVWQKNTFANMSFGNVLKLVIKVYSNYHGSVVATVGHLRTYEKLMADFINSYIIYMRAMIDICRLHS